VSDTERSLARGFDPLRGFDVNEALAGKDAELEKLLLALLDVLDSFDRLAAANAGDSIRGIDRQLRSALHAAGLESVAKAGLPADPETHRVVEARSDGDIVIEVLRQGYVFRGRVLRPAAVVVGSDASEVEG
jgi:molecular chaperone GrpE (heat shock protein)